MEGNGNIFFYQAESGNNQIEVKLEHDTVWLTQSQIIELFQSSRANISEHIKHIFNSGELKPDSTIRNFRIVRKEGNRLISRELEHYSLDMIISIGYRVNSVRGTQFRIWANQVLKEYLVKGYALDKKRFQEQSRQLEELKQTVKLLGNVIESKTLNSDEEINSAPALFSEMKRMILFRDLWQPSIRLSEGKTYTRVWKRKLGISYILSLRIILSQMGTNESPPSCLYGSWRKTRFYTAPTAPKK